VRRQLVGDLGVELLDETVRRHGTPRGEGVRLPSTA
jgi:hypothetical protein